MIAASLVAVVFGCNRYPTTPRDVVVGFLRATQAEKSDAKAYLSTQLKSNLSAKGLKYTFRDASVQQSVPQADDRVAVLVKKVRLGGGGIVTETDMRVVVTMEKDHWVISRLVAGVTDPGGRANNDWLVADGIPL